MPNLKIAEQAILEVQATLRSGDADPTAGTIGISIRFFKDSHGSDGYYWTGSAWQAGATVITSTQKDFHAHQYTAPNTMLVSGMQGGRLVVRAADAGAIGPSAEWDVVAVKLDGLALASVNTEVRLARLDADVSSRSSHAAPDLSNLDQAISTTEANIRGVDSDTLKTLSDQVDDISLTAEEIADAMWDEVMSTHQLDGSTGAALNIAALMNIRHMVTESLNIWYINEEILVELFLADSETGEGLTGQAAFITLKIQRASDDNYFSGVVWQEASAELTMTEIDAVEQPGRYQYVLPAAANNQKDVYVAHANVSNPPTVEGDNYEVHVSRDLLTPAHVKVYESEAS